MDPACLIVVLPFHNKAENLERVMEGPLAEEPAIPARPVFMIVDDGCTDATPEIIRRLKDRHADICTVKS